MPGFRLVTEPTRIPVPGDKLIEEYFGRVNTGTGAFSLAHMVAPPGWSEPAQTPEFGELTLVLGGRLRVDLTDGSVEVPAGSAFWAEPGHRVRYHNPSDQPCEYWSFCIPAFSPDTVHRETRDPEA